MPSSTTLRLTPLLLPLLLITPAAAQDNDDPLGNLYGDERKQGDEALPKQKVPRAAALLARGRHDEAEALLKEVLEAEPDLERPRLLLARLLLKTGRPAEAAQAGAHLRKIQADKPAGYLIQGIVLERAGKLTEAAKVFASAAVLGEGSDLRVEAWVRHAELLADVDSAKAEAVLRRVLQHYKDTPALGADAFVWTGRACRLAQYFPKLESEYSKHMADYARRMFDQAFAKQKDHAEAHKQAGYLALDTYDHPLAKKSFQKVVARDPNDPEARVGLARATLESFYGGSGRYTTSADHLKKALSADPTFPGAHAALAGISIVDGNYPKALERIAIGLQARPSSVELLAAKAAVRILRGDPKGFAAIETALLATRPRCARFYVAVASLVQMKFRYAESKSLCRKALQVDPGYHAALPLLGVNLTRTGEEKEGRRILKAAFREDPYNVFVFNHLQLWDRLDKEYVTIERPGFTIRMHTSEKLVATRYVVSLLEEAKRELGKKYGAIPKRVVVELFPKHADFSARSVGLPGIPALGVCFGNVVTVLSSKEKKAVGAHSWGRTLWHEFAHVATLTRSKNRVPRWLTEGLSVFEEPRGRPTWQREYDTSIITLMARDLLLPVATLDEGFTKPRYPGQVMMSYYQGGMMCEFITDTWGFPKILKLLDAFAAGKDTQAAIPATFGMSCEDFDARFWAFLERRYERISWRPPPSLEQRQQLLAQVTENPWDVSARGALARAYVLHGLTDDAQAQARKTLALAREAQQRWGALGADGPGGGLLAGARALAIRAGAGDAHFALGMIARRSRRAGKATRHFKRALALGTRDPVQAHMSLGTLYRVRKRLDQAIEHYQAARRASPPMAGLWHLLSACYKTKGDTARSMACLKQAILLDSNDTKSRITFAKWAKEQNRWAEVLEVMDDINLIDPFLPDAHVLLGEALRRGAIGKTQTAMLTRAIGEYQAALELKVTYAAQPYFGWADCLNKLGQDPKKQLELVRKALIDDPDHTEARALKTKLEAKDKKPVEKPVQKTKAP